jgi:hypothetical protein
MLGDIALGFAGLFGAFDAKNVPAPEYRKVLADAMQGQVMTEVPTRYQVAQQYSPQYSALQSRLAEQMLFGGPGAPGLLSMQQRAQPFVSGVESAEEQARAAARASLMEQLGGSMWAGTRAYDRGAGELSDALMMRAMQDVALGGRLSPEEERLATQHIRQGQLARGMGRGPSDAYLEAMRLNTLGEQRRNERLARAGSILGQRTQMYQSPFLAMLSGGAGSTARTVGAGYGQPVTQLGDIGPAFSLAELGYKGQLQTELANLAARTKMLENLQESIAGAEGAGLKTALGFI